MRFQAADRRGGGRAVIAPSEAATLELVLALQLLGAPAASAPEVHLVPALSLAAASSPASPRDGPAEITAPAPALPRPVRPGTLAASALGVVLADVGAMVPILYGFLLCLGDVMSYGTTGGCDRGIPFIVVGTVAFAVLPPAGALIGARAAGERGDAGWSAYGLALVVRLGAFGLAATMPEELGVLTVVATELVLTPYVVARTLAGAPPIEQARAPPLAAVPVRDPAGWRGSTGR